MKTALSFVVGGKLDHDHNARRSIPAYADPSKTEMNKYIERDARQVVAAWYKEELETHNAKLKGTKNSERQITDLFEKYSKLYDNAKERDKKERSGNKYTNKAKCPEKEVILQLGDVDSHPSEAESKVIFAQYIKEFQQRNPCFKLTGAYIHLDEGTPHMHLDFVYKADRQPTLNKMYSFENALNQMGYEKEYSQAENRTITAFEKWLNVERAAIKEIAKTRDITVIEGKMEEKREHLSREAYIIKAKEENNQKKEKKLAEYEKYLEERAKELKAEKVAEIKELEAKKTEIKGEVEEMEEIKAKNKAEVGEVIKTIKKGNEEIDRIQNELDEKYEKIDNLQAELDRKNKDLDRVEELYNQYKGNPLAATLDMVKLESKLENTEKTLKKLTQAIKKYCKEEEIKKIFGQKEVDDILR